MSCKSNQKYLCGECRTCLDRSFMKATKENGYKYDYVQCWSLKNKESPCKVLLTTLIKFHFTCNICNHNFTQKPYRIIKMGRWCPYCPNQKLCKEEKCKICYDKSFAKTLETDKRHIWHEKNKNITPRNVFPKTHKKYWLKCVKNDHLFKAQLSGITRGRGCPNCGWKTEFKLFEFLVKNYNVIRSKSFNWCKNSETGKHFIFDFYIPEKNVLIELDGGQHFKQVMNWKDPDKIRYNDVYKMTNAIKKEIRIIRLLQEEVFSLKLQEIWQKRLIEAIESEDKVTYIICSDRNREIYECHQDELEYELEKTKET